MVSPTATGEVAVGWARLYRAHADGRKFPRGHKERAHPTPGEAGFTLIELLVVMAIIALLLAIAVPRYYHSVDRAKEAVLRENLATTRLALDKYYGDTGKYPDTLEMLVEKKYLRTLPYDPVADSATAWVVVPPDAAEKGVVFDVKSGAPGLAFDGTEYGKW